MTGWNHTPGPWTINKTFWQLMPDEYAAIREKGIAHINAKDWSALASVVVATEEDTDEGGLIDEPSPEGEANAMLIAAAPDLLETLVECYEQLALMAKDPKTNPLVQQAKAAIAKATGDIPWVDA